MMKRALILCVSTVIIMCSMMTACSESNKEIKDTVYVIPTSTEQSPSNTPTSEPKQAINQETADTSYDNEKKNDIIAVEDTGSNEAAPIPTEPTTPEPTEATPTEEPVDLDPSEPSKSEESEIQENKPEQNPEPTPTQKPVTPEPSKKTEPTSKPSKKPEPTTVPTKKPTSKPQPTSTPTPKPTEKPRPAEDFVNTEGKGDKRDAGVFSTSDDKLVTVNKDVDYSVNLKKLNGMIGSTYGLGYTPTLSSSGLDGSVATLKYKSDTNRYGIEIFGWRHSYDSNTAENNALNAVLETFYFLCGDKKVAYALWSFVDAASIDGYANTDDFGFRDTATFENGFSAIMDGVEVDVINGDGTITFYFK